MPGEIPLFSKMYRFDANSVNIVGGLNNNGLFVLDYLVPTTKTITITKLQIAANQTNVLSSFTNASTAHHILLYTDTNQNSYVGKLMTVSFDLS